MKISFPYQQWEGVGLPLIPVAIRDLGTFYAIIDSGANISLFQSAIADLLGIRIESGKKIPLSGIGGNIAGYIHRIPLKVAGFDLCCRVCFSRETKVPINLLGREDFFKNFQITFDEKKNRVILNR